MLLLLLVAYRAGRDAPWGRGLLLPALLCALTLLSKASGLVFIPVCLVALEAEHAWENWRAGRFRWRMHLRPIVVGLLGAVLLFLLCPQALTAFRFQILHNLNGHGLIYLFGRTSPNGFWYYFPAALEIKTSLALLLILAATLCRPRLLLNGPFLAAAGLLVLSPAYRTQIGVRFALPILALAVVGAAIAFSGWLSASTRPWHRRLALGLVVAAVVWTGTQAIHVWPQGICYTNELFGGTDEGYRLLSDSNHDWGQGLPELARWHRRHAEAPLALWYFGTDPRCQRPPFIDVEPSRARSVDHLRGGFRGHYLAVSTSMLHGAAHDSMIGKYLRTLAPVGRTTTFLIFAFREPSPGRSPVVKGTKGRP